MFCSYSYSKLMIGTCYKMKHWTTLKLCHRPDRCDLLHSCFDCNHVGRGLSSVYHSQYLLCSKCQEREWISQSPSLYNTNFSSLVSLGHWWRGVELARNGVTSYGIEIPFKCYTGYQAVFTNRGSRRGRHMVQWQRTPNPHSFQSDILLYYTSLSSVRLLQLVQGLDFNKVNWNCMLINLFKEAQWNNFKLS